MSEEQEEIKQYETQTNVCPNCGGRFGISADGKQLVCAYCNTTMPITQIIEKNEKNEDKSVDFGKVRVNKIPLEVGLQIEKKSLKDDGSSQHIIKCKNCGGETIIEGDNLSISCVFCGSPHTVSSSELPGIKPQLLVTFNVDGTKARKIMISWKSHLFWSPKKFKTHLVEDISHNAVFLPYWNFDTNSDSNYTANRGDYYYITVHKTRTVNGKTEHYTVRERRTRWTRVSGKYNRWFSNLLSCGSSNANVKLMAKTASFSYAGIVEFNQTYLTDHLAEKYSKGLAPGWNEVKAGTQNTLTKEIRRRIGGDEIANLNINTNYYQTAFNLLYLPFYIVGYSYLKHVYQIIINGQNGKIAGTYPVSKLKVLIFTIIILALIAGLGFLIYNAILAE